MCQNVLEAQRALIAKPLKSTSVERILILNEMELNR